jgi:hypothetical protein
MDTANLEAKLKGRTDDQKKVINYFLEPDGCLSNKISDEEYDQMVRNILASLNLKQKALDKIGIDESQVNEIPPCEFHHWHYEKDKTYSKYGKDGIYRTSAYQVSWLFFSDLQVYVYQYTFNMDEDGKKERTEEYFWKDITNFSTTTESVEIVYTVNKGFMSESEEIRKTVDRDIFKLIVPGDAFASDIARDDDAENKVKGMKNKLREKKG